MTHGKKGTATLHYVRAQYSKIYHWGSKMRKFIWVLALFLGFVVCDKALANTEDSCTQYADTDLSIRACTLIIEGRAAGNLAAAYARRGDCYRVKRDYDRAIDDLDHAIRLAPDLAAAYGMRGAAHGARNEYDLALKDFDEAIRLDPKFAYNYTVRGEVHYLRGDYGLASKDFDLAVRLAPDDPDTYRSRGAFYGMKGEVDRAINDFERAIRLAPNDAATYEKRGSLYGDKGEYDRAIADYDEAIRLNPSFSTAYAHRAVVYSMRGEDDRALTDLSLAVRLAPNDPEVHLRRAEVYSAKGEYDHAMADINYAIRLDPESGSNFLTRGTVYYRRGEYERAVTDFDQAIRLVPSNSDAYRSRAKALFSTGNTKDAKADADKAVTLRPNFENRDTRGHILLALGETSAAFEDFNEALRFKKDAINSLWGRGQVYERQGLRSLAIADYRQAIEQKPSGSKEDIDAQREARARLLALEAKQSPPTFSSETPKSALGHRVALVIGNGAYQTVSKLSNPANDASAIATQLNRLGFEVIEKHDLPVEGMRRALAEFETRAAGADWALVFYAGHGMELGGVNWLIPVDAKLMTSNDAPDEAVPLDRVLDRVRAAKKLRIVFLDACRNNPFLSRMIITAGRTRAVERGLAPIEPQHGEVVFYASRDGSVASDGAGDHSPFTAALLLHLNEENVELGRFFRKVTTTVLSSTQPQQEPFVYGRIPDEDFYFKPPR